MNDQYEECGWTSEKLADEELFIREVIREDTDLMLVMAIFMAKHPFGWMGNAVPACGATLGNQSLRRLPMTRAGTPPTMA